MEKIVGINDLKILIIHPYDFNIEESYEIGDY